MNIVIRTDASVQIGTGHVMRCLTLAERLNKESASIHFVSRELPGHLCDLIEKSGYTLSRLVWSEERAEDDKKTAHSSWRGVSLQTDAEETAAFLAVQSQPADWLIVDHYALDAEWEKQMRLFVKKIMVIDDLAD